MTGEVLVRYEEMTPDAVRETAMASHAAFLSWRRTHLGARAELMNRAAETLRRNAGEYAGLMAREMGKPIRQGLSEIEKCA